MDVSGLLGNSAVTARGVVKAIKEAGGDDVTIRCVRKARQGHKLSISKIRKAMGEEE